LTGESKDLVKLRTSGSPENLERIIRTSGLSENLERIIRTSGLSENLGFSLRLKIIRSARQLRA